MKRIRLFLANILYYSGFLWITKRFCMQRGFLQILCFHRVLRIKNESLLLFDRYSIISENTFRDMIQYLVRAYHIAPLEQICVTERSQHTTPARRKTLYLTFDDGWIDNYLYAFPILREHHVPATIFLTTGFIGQFKKMWQQILWDDSLRFTDDSAKYAEMSSYLLKQGIPLPPGPITVANYASIARNIIESLKRFPSSVRKEILLEISRIWNFELSDQGDTRFFLNWDEVKTMSHHGITFGSHSHSHHILPFEPEDRIQEEVMQSKKILESELGQEILFFAFPNGKSDKKTENIVEKSRYKAAFILDAERSLYIKNNPLAINRIYIDEDSVRDLNGTFSKSLFEFNTNFLFLTIRQYIKKIWGLIPVRKIGFHPSQPVQPVNPKILYLIDALGLGGTEKQVVSHLKHINQEKFEVILCCLRTNTSQEKDIQLPGRVINLDIQSLRKISTLLKIWRFVGLIKKKRIAIINTFFFDSHLVGLLAGKLAGVPMIICHQRNLGYADNFWRKISYKLTDLFTDRFCANSKSAYEYLVLKRAMFPGKIDIIYNGVDLSSLKRCEDPIVLKQLRDTMQIPQGWMVVGCVSNIRPIKGVTYLIRAAAMVKKENPETFFIFVGDGPLRKEMEEQCYELGLRNSVHFTGAVRNVKSYLSLLHVGVLPSLSEAFSNSLLELMAFGLPVVATDVGGNKEVVEDGVNGFLVEPENPEALASAILTLLSNKDLREKMGRASMGKIVNHYAMSQSIAKFESYYNNLLKTNT